MSARIVSARYQSQQPKRDYFIILHCTKCNRLEKQPTNVISDGIAAFQQHPNAAKTSRCLEQGAYKDRHNEVLETPTMRIYSYVMTPI